MVSLSAIPEGIAGLFGITRAARIRRDLESDLRLVAAIGDRKDLEKAREQLIELVNRETERLAEWTERELDGQRQWSSIIGGMMTLGFLSMIAWFIFWRPFDQWWKYPLAFVIAFFAVPVILLVIRAIAQKDHLPNGQ